MNWKTVQIINKYGLYKYLRPIWIAYDKIAIFRRIKEKNFYSSFVQKDSLCFDVGACIGNKSDIFLNLGAKVVAIEAYSKNIAYLKNKYKNNKNIKIVNAALSSSIGKTKLFINPDEPAIGSINKNWVNNSRFSENFNKNNYRIVKTKTLDFLIKNFGTPMFCKIDVEGNELKVIKGLKSKLELISFEFHKENLSDTKSCIIHLSSFGRYKFNYVKYDSMKFENDLWISGSKLIKEIYKINDKYLWGDIYAKIMPEKV